MLDLKKSSDLIRKRVAALTESQSVDVQRRSDICAGVEASAYPLFLKKHELQETKRLLHDSKRQRSFSRWAIFIIGGLVVSVTDSQGWEIFGWSVCGFAGLRWVLESRDQRQLDEKLEANGAALSALAGTWVGAGGSQARFWTYGELVRTGEMTLASPNFKQWWHERQKDILSSVDGKHYDAEFA